jgi:hypothetical protein
MADLPDGYAALTMTSPPYENCRTYGVGFKLKGQAWVDWMIPRVAETCRVTAGLVCVNMAAPVRDFRYSPAVEWLVADLTRHHGVVCGPAPYVYHRSGIPGSGGPHYHRRDWEPVYCFARPENLPPRWSDNTAMGRPPKWAVGGEMAHRLQNGKRKNDGKSQRQVARENGYPMRFGPSGTDDSGLTVSVRTYIAPEIANPGNVAQETYTAEEVAALLGESGDVLKCIVGGGNLGDGAAHDSEAPFSERLVEFFVRSYAPPDSIVLDPFAGSGTTVAVAYRCGRRGHGMDVRQSQADVTARRLGNVTRELFA